MFSFKNLSVYIQETPIIHGISQSFKPSELVIITGDNGSGKSTLVSALMGLSGYHVTGSIMFNGQEINTWPLEKRAQAGMFLAFQHPLEIPGLPITTFLQHAYRVRHGAATPLDLLHKKIDRAFQLVGLPLEYSKRNVHEGFSGGQKKRFELVQMLVLEPQIIILDEPDSGLDVQGIDSLVQVINQYRATHQEAIFIIITHNTHVAERFHAATPLTMRGGTLV